MSELSELRALVETTREDVSDQTKVHDQVSTATNELREELQGTHSLAKAASGNSSKVLHLLETTIPAAFLSLEARLGRVEEAVAAAAETAAVTVASAKDAAAAATAAASAASALARRYDESVVGSDGRERRPVDESESDSLGRIGARSRNTDGGRLCPPPRQRYQQQHEGQQQQHEGQQQQHQRQRQQQQRHRQQEEHQQHQEQRQQHQQHQQHQQRQEEQQQQQRQQRQDQRQVMPPSEFRQGGVSPGSAQESSMRSSRKRKTDDQQAEHHAPPSRRILPPDGGDRITKEPRDTPQALQRFNHDSQGEESSWQGADESLRWTQPWGGGAGRTTAPAAGASSRVRQSPRHDPETSHGVFEERSSGHGRSGGDRFGRLSPPAGGASSSLALSAVANNNSRTSQRVAADDGADVDVPSSSLPLCEADSFNPFQDADLVPTTAAAAGSIAAKVPGNVSTSARQGSRSPPAPNTSRAEQPAATRSGLIVRPAAAPAAAHSSSGKSPVADATGAAVGAAAARTVSSSSSSSSTSRRPTSSTAGTRGPDVPVEPSPAGGSQTRMVTRRAKTRLGQGDGGAGRTQAAGAGDAPVGRMAQGRQPPPPPRPSGGGLSVPHAAASVDPFSFQGPSAGGGDPGSSQGNRRTPAAQKKTNRKLSHHDVSVRSDRRSDSAARRVSGSEQAEEGFSWPVGRTLHEEVGQRKPTSSDAGVVEDEIEDYEDSFGGPGLTVEAYMAEKRKAKRNQNKDTPTGKKAVTARQGDEENAAPKTKRANTRKQPPSHNRPSSRRGSMVTPTSAAGDTNAGGGRNGRSNSDSWMVGGGSGW
ncbi:unnamed protein product [Ectocarpus fasciculatus]